MNISNIQSICVSKSTLHLVRIETDVSRGLFYFDISGNIHKSISESKSRILSSLRNCEFETPNRKSQKVLISITPHTLTKDGGELDLAILISYLSASKQISIPNMHDICCIGRVRIDGEVFAEYTLIEQCIYLAWKQGVRKFIIPSSIDMRNIGLPDITICQIQHVRELHQTLIFSAPELATDIHASLPERAVTHHLITQNTTSHTETITNQIPLDIDHIQGLSIQKRALCIALAGNHHILFTGQPGTGKTALLQCIPGLLDALSLDELGDMIITRSCIPYVQRPQYHLTPTTSPTTLIGNKRIPGVIDHAHFGVITLNELCEFNKKTIESLRICMESDSHISDDKHTTSSALICASSNNCPCGSNTVINTSHSISSSAQQNTVSPHTTTPEPSHTCTCTPHQIRLYQSKLSEPVRDRFPIICNFSYTERSGHTPLTHTSNDTEISHLPQEAETDTSTHAPKNEASRAMTLKQIIGDCRYMSRKRNNGLYNQQLSLASIRQFGITSEASNTLDALEHHFKFSHRKKLHTMRVARTIADLDFATQIDTSHILEAISYVKTTPFT